MPVRREDKWSRQDHYTVLGVEPSASTTQITTAYRRLVRVLHPDVHPAEPAAHERFAEVIEAYTILRDPDRRAAYDAGRGQDAPGACEGLGGRPVSVRVTHVSGPPRSSPGPAFADVADHGVTIDPFVPAAPLDRLLLRAGPARLSPSRRDRHDRPLLGYDSPWLPTRLCWW